MFDNSVTRSQWGQNNTRDSETLSDLPVQDETKLHYYLDDFDYYNGPVSPGTTNGYVLTGTDSTVTMASADGGAINLNGLTTGFIATLQRSAASFQLATGFRTWYTALSQLSTLSSSTQLILGLTNITTTPFSAITDGVWLSSAATTGALSVNVATNSTVTTVATGASVVAGNTLIFKWYWDGGIYAAAPNGQVVWEVSGPGSSANLRGAIPAPTGFPRTTLLAPQWGVKATAGTPTLLIDLTGCIKERVSVLATPVF